MDGGDHTPGHNGFAESFSFSQIFFGIKGFGASSTRQFELDQVLCHEEMPQIMRGETNRTKCLERRVVAIPVPVKRFRRVGCPPFGQKERGVRVNVDESVSSLWIMETSHLLTIRVYGPHKPR